MRPYGSNAAGTVGLEPRGDIAKGRRRISKSAEVLAVQNRKYFTPECFFITETQTRYSDHFQKGPNTSVVFKIPKVFESRSEYLGGFQNSAEVFGSRSEHLCGFQNPPKYLELIENRNTSATPQILQVYGSYCKPEYFGGYHPPGYSEPDRNTLC